MPDVSTSARTRGPCSATRPVLRCLVPFAGLLASVLGPVVAYFALVAVVAAGPARAEGTPKLLLLPIVVHSAEDPDYLREGLADMLNARLARLGNLELVHASSTTAGTTELARAQDTARKLGADYVLFGSFTQFGQGASLDVQCASATGGPREPLREIFVHSGSIGDIIPDLDELAGKVSRFARGETVASNTPSGAPAATLSARELQALLSRVKTLEATVSELEAKKKSKRE